MAKLLTTRNNLAIFKIILTVFQILVNHLKMGEASRLGGIMQQFNNLAI